MKKSRHRTLLTLAVAIASSLLMWSCGSAPQAETIAIIPQPVSLVQGSGSFTLDKSTVVVYPDADEAMFRAADMAARTLGKAIGEPTLKLSTHRVANSVTFEPLTGTVADQGAEAYTLKVTPEGVTIAANSYSGAYYGLVTLTQLLPAEVYGAGSKSEAYRIPAVDIEDYPRFGWRGMHLDVSRHFFNADEVKKYIDYLAMNKLNRFHWHLTDDQGWRMESKKYPLLTEKSAWRVDRSADDWDNREPLKEGEKATYGGFYTQDEIRDVVAYAAARGIQVVPEIEIPGHSSEIFAAYPELSCLGTLQSVTPGGYYPPDMATCYCAGNEQSFVFLEGIIDEVIELFPDAPYIHVGGDEVDKRFWANCPKCKARMKAEGLKNVDELQSYFIQRMERYINSKGKPIIGWDEILEGGVAPNATVMSWRGIAGGIEAARAGHDVIMTPNSHLYFDYYQGNPEVEPKTIGGLITTKRVYGYDPIPEVLTPEEAKHILGAQANLWAEFIPTFSGVEYMALPRMSALSEVVWSPAAARDWVSFSERLVVNNQRLGAMGANFHPGTDQIDFSTSYDSVTKTFSIGMVAELFGSDIHYTVDGSDPTINSTKYTEPIQITETSTVKAVVVRDGKVFSKKPSARIIGMHKGVGKKVSYNKRPADAYLGAAGAKTLVDGFTGSTRHDDGFMQGFNNHDFDVVVDLEQTTKFTEVSGSFMQSTGTWIYLPVEMVVSVSDDGTTWREVGRVGHDIDAFKVQTTRHQFDLRGDFEGRYVRIVGVNKPTAKGLPGAGTVNWIFADEIFIN